MKYRFRKIEPQPGVSVEDWNNWKWQFKSALKTKDDFKTHFILSEDEERAFDQGSQIFRFQTTPYYANLADKENTRDPIRQILVPHINEISLNGQQLFDPLGERKNSPHSRLIHRYKDRVLFLVTDMCSVYCRYCTRKHFTGQDQVFLKESEYQSALTYIRSTTTLREVILSGGDPLTLGDSILEKVLRDLRNIDHIDIIRIGTRIPVVAPMRVTEDLAKLLRSMKPVYVLTHFNHPQELTADAAEALERLVDNGVPVLNQMVLLNGVNNSASVIEELSRKLLYLRVKPYYVHQCDPSEGSPHFRTRVDDTLKIQKELFGHVSGLAMPQFSLDIPGGGGKTPLVPNHLLREENDTLYFRGFDGVEGQYENPPKTTV